ncbi:MAG TPA: M28 family peptidase, partial [Thermomicrobiales bacterium]|nr:M28 family peptidase [Thermomicrobiales bacterium]
TGAIAIDAHYDSGATGPGAMDAGSGVVTTLETLRAILAGPALRNDLIVVFADAEEEGMLGAAAFNEQHPWAADVQLAINFEGAGGDGPALLYATSEQNNWLVSEYLDAAPDPAATSLLAEIVNLYKAGRLDCDLGEYTDKGSAGLGFVVLGDTPVYHTIRDNPDEIDSGSIQQEGANTLAAVRHFGNLDLSDTPTSGNRVFFNIWPGVVVHYAATWALALAVVVTIIVAGLLVTGLRRGELTRRGLLAGSLAYLLGTLGAVAFAAALWFAIHALNADYQVMLIGNYQAGFYTVALALVTVAVVAALYTLLDGRIRRQNLIAGVLLGGLLPLWFASLAVPGMSYLIAWPLLFATLPLAWTLFAGRWAAQPWRMVAVLSVAAIPAIVLLPGTLHAMLGLVNRLEGLSGLGLLGLLMLFVAPLAGLFVPHLHFVAGERESSRRRWALPGTIALVAIALLAWGNVTSGFDADQPRPNRIAYELNADTGQASWVSYDRQLDNWTEQFFPAGVDAVDHETAMLGTLSAFVAPAPPATVALPEVVVLNDTNEGDLRTLTLNIASPANARISVVDVAAPGEVVAVAVDGRQLDINGVDWARDGEFPIIYRNVPDGGWQLSLTVRSIDPITVTIEETTDGLPDVPGMTIEPRPAWTMAAAGYAYDPTTVIRTFRFD